MNVTAEGLDDDTNAINFIRDVVIGAHYRDLLIGVVHVAVFQRDGRMASLCRGLTTIFEGRRGNGLCHQGR
jgi:hypothetical protein